MNPNEEAAAQLAKHDFRYYIPYVFYTLNPKTKFKDNWHLDYLAYLLARTMPDPLNPTPNDKIKRLIINVPPRTLKSELVSVAYPSFILGHFPHERIIGASYSGTLSEKMGMKTRKVTQTPWYHSMFPAFKVGDKDNSREFWTSENGFRYSTSVGGTVTGEGGNFLLGDDLLNSTEASYKTQRIFCNDWYDETFSSRVNDAENAVVIIIMQRLHEMDLTGHLLAKNKKLPPSERWYHVCLPAICPKTQTFEYYGIKKVWEEGELLHPTHLSQKVLDVKQIDHGTYAYVGQFLQRPSPKGGGIIKISWFRRYSEMPKKYKRIVQSWDTAFKANAGADPSVCTTWGEMSNGFDLLEVFRKKMEYPELKAEFERLKNKKYNDQPVDAILVEDRASGQSLEQDFRGKCPVLALKPEKDKIARISAQSAVIEAGMVGLPIYADWLPAFEAEFAMFPTGAHDDQVDSTSQALNWMRKSGLQQYRVTLI